MNPAFIPTPTVSLISIPARQGPKQYVGQPSKAYALACDCGHKDLVCGHIRRIILSGKDAPLWWSKVSTLGLRPKDGNVEFGIPLFDHVLHRVELAYQEIQTWDGGSQFKLKVTNDVWYSDHSRFYDADVKGIGTVLTDQIRELEASTSDIPEGNDMVGKCMSFAVNDAQNPPQQCDAGTHNYGTNKRLLDWLRTEREISYPKVHALAFCYLMYGLCFICYSNREPAFSLVKM